MRGNLIHKSGWVEFVPDTNGEYEVVDGGKIVPYGTLQFAVNNLGKPHWTDEAVRNFNKLQEDYALHGKPKQEQAESNPEKDWVIRALISRNGDKLTGYWDEETLKYSEGYEIYSVRRNSDNEEFTVDEITEQGKITAITVDEKFWGGLKVTVDGNESLALYRITKKKDKPLKFITTDGVTIYHRDSFYLINNHWEANHFTAISDSYCESTDGKNVYPKTFSTKEKAEEYIALNKPMFSVNEIIEKTMPIKLSNRNDRLLIVSQLLQSAKEKMES